MDEIVDFCIYYIYNVQLYIFFNLYFDCMMLKDLLFLCLNDVRYWLFIQ